MDGIFSSFLAERCYFIVFEISFKNEGSMGFDARLILTSLLHFNVTYANSSPVSSRNLFSFRISVSSVLLLGSDQAI